MGQSNLLEFYNFGRVNCNGLLIIGTTDNSVTNLDVNTMTTKQLSWIRFRKKRSISNAFWFFPISEGLFAVKYSVDPSPTNHYDVSDWYDHIYFFDTNGKLVPDLSAY